MSEEQCHDFKPHLLRPDKCRTCLVELDRHPKRMPTNNNSTAGTPEPSALSATTTSLPEGKGGECSGCHKLARELDEWRTRCRSAEDDSRRARDELRSLENEMEEMHDNFKEEESEQFEQVKQELDACLKNCKILQIRLNKSERQYGQLEQVKQMLERQLEEQSLSTANITNTTTSGSSPVNSRSLQAHRNEEDSVGSNAAGLVSMQQDGEFVSVATREYDQLLRDLNDTSERERDLQEQIKYSQEEAQLKGERLQAIEAENEVLLGRIQKLTLANSSLRSRMMSATGRGSQEETLASTGGDNKQQQQQQQQSPSADKTRELCEQNEQLKLALELAQSEGEQLRRRVQELQQTLEARDRSLKEVETKLEELRTTSSFSSDQNSRAEQATSGGGGGGGRHELECRQLRARLAQAERQCRQLRSQCESSEQLEQQQAAARRRTANTTALSASGQRSHSMEEPAQQQQRQQVCPSGKCSETVRSLERQCKGLVERNAQLEVKVQRLIEVSSHNLDSQANMETDLFDKLKRQLDTSESELAKAKSRLVELDIECGRAQRQYKRLLNSLESCGSAGGELAHLRRNKLPPSSDALRDSLSRAELRQAMRELELDIDDLVGVVKSKECLIRELGGSSSLSPPSGAELESGANLGTQTGSDMLVGEQVKSLRRQLDQEQLLSANLKLDVANLEQQNGELRARCQLLERERVAMEAELDKMRTLLGEQRAELEESERERSQALNKSRDLLEALDKIRLELIQARQQQQQQQRQQQKVSQTSGTGSGPAEISSTNSGQHSPQQNTDFLLMSRDLSELKVKNGFLMRQLELARDDTTRQLEDLRTANEAQQRRAVELAQLELKERQLQESQRLRDELQETKQKLAHYQRQVARQEEEVTQERDRWRALERDWRRDKSQWQQTREQLEGQLAIEKRSSEFRLKEAEAAIRDKERSLTGVQERAVQLERDLKRLQNRYHLLEEDGESKCKQLTRDLEICTKNLHELQKQKQERDEQLYEATKRLQSEKSTLKETLETIKRSYDEKLAEARQLRELLQVRQEQSYKDRTQQLDRIEELSRRLNDASGLDSQVKLLKQRLEIQERQLELVRRELGQVKEERTRLRARCDELEKRELITKTSSISGAQASHSFLKPFGSKSQFVGRSSAASSSSPTSAQPPVSSKQVVTEQATAALDGQQQPLVERLSGKINDQRHLIDMLRQQLNETQLELRQLKLLQSNERSRWQAQVALLQSRLNECEEKLANETAMLARNASSQLMRDLVGPRLEASWTRERAANQELVRQQQQQIEALARDLKKTSQAHDLLRLHSKQLESHNNKLSRKLIEYQQQSSVFKLADRELETNYEQLRRQHAKLERDTRPLVEIVAKIVSSLDAPEQPQQVAPAKSPLADSTERPLRAGAAAAVRVARQQQQQQQRDSDGSESELSTLSLVTTPRPAHQVHQQHQQQSRLTRLLAGGKPSGTGNGGGGQEQDKMVADSTANAKRATPTTTKTVKRVRVKCSTLGITTNEKKLLKQQLKALTEALDATQGPPANSPSPGELSRTGSVTPTGAAGGRNLDSTANTTTFHTRPRTVNTPTPRGEHSSQVSSSATSQSRVVHWQMDSDLESERSWSLEPTGNSGTRTDVYRRFPQATPSSTSNRAHSSLTDYDSESSLASDYSLGAHHNLSSTRYHLTPSSSSGANGGAESDSGLLVSGSAHLSGRKKSSSSGFKGRLTNTLRNLSRSITGGLGGSDTEDSSTVGRRAGSQVNQDKRASSVLKEIRV